MQAAPRRITSELAYIDHFYNRDLKASRHGFVYANVCAAVKFLEQQAVPALLPDEMRTGQDDGPYQDLYDAWFQVADVDGDRKACLTPFWWTIVKST